MKARVNRQAGNTYSEAFNCYLFHAGIDFSLSEGTVIRVLHEEIVTYAGEDPLLGYKVEIDGGDGWNIIYGGLENLRVKQGDTVDRLDAIGQVGINPGAESQDSEPELHFEVWHNDLVQVPII